MAGSEKRGVQFAQAELFTGALCVTTPDETTDPDAVNQIEAFWQTLGMRTIRLTPDEHDRRAADISHLPHALAAALVTMQTEPSLALAGKGFADVTRSAAGDGGLWRDIFLDNRDHLRDSLARLRGGLDELLTLLEPGKSQELKAWLDAAAAKRQAWAQGMKRRQA